MKNAEKHACRIQTVAAIRSGLIVMKSCEICGDKKVQVHHLDYSDPMKVMWLCRTHHLEAHGKIAREYKIKDFASVSLEKEAKQILERLARLDQRTIPSEIFVLAKAELARRGL
jgi:hypothetical protein